MVSASALLPCHDGLAWCSAAPRRFSTSAGLRVVTELTFDGPGPHGYLIKTEGSAVTQDRLADVGRVLLSHYKHADNVADVAFVGSEFLDEGDGTSMGTRTLAP
ncbi:hypothetical protein ACIQUM_36885 [Amycolatopsis azurea]|uniref:hypothetical protein n=1 Tax=Amycolatopsis azurea TaxID=36819 RepID=UPI00381BD6B5